MNARRSLILAAVLAIAAGGAAASAASKRTYYALVFSAPVAGREDEYNRWYDQEHVPAVVSVPGFVSAQRYIRSDLQLRPNAGASPPYLVVYKIVTDDLAATYREVAARAADGRTRMSNTMARGSGMNLTYLVTDSHRWRERSPSGGTPAYLHIVLADSQPGEEDALDRWYRVHHGHDMSALPGFGGYRLGILAPTQMVPDAHGSRHLALFQITTPDLSATIATFRLRAPTMSPGPTMKNLWGYTYRAIGPVQSPR